MPLKQHMHSCVLKRSSLLTIDFTTKGKFLFPIPTSIYTFIHNFTTIKQNTVWRFQRISKIII